jgi:hypothetical protein
MDQIVALEKQAYAAAREPLVPYLLERGGQQRGGSDRCDESVPYALTRAVARAVALARAVHGAGAAARGRGRGRGGSAAVHSSIVAPPAPSRVVGRCYFRRAAMRLRMASMVNPRGSTFWSVHSR